MTSGYVVVPTIATILSAVRVGSWALRGEGSETKRTHVWSFTHREEECSARGERGALPQAEPV